MSSKPSALSPQTWGNSAGICLSLTCAAHCLAAPLLVPLLPLTGGRFLLNDRIEFLLLICSLMVTTGSLALGYSVHRRPHVFLIVGTAFGLVTVGRSFFDGSHEIAWVVSGAGLLTASHLLNLSHCRSCKICHEELFVNHPDPVLKATVLSLAYGDHTVLADVSFEVHPGEFWVLLGQNGGGKTTLLRAILGLLSPRSGSLWLHPELASRARTGFVPQRCDLTPTLPTTVREFVLLGLVGLHVHRREEQERLTWALEKMGLAGMAARSYWALSGGQRQRALVARALVRRPTFLVLDEPTNNLDAPTEDALLQLLGALNREEQQTIMLVTHNLSLAQRYATHVAFIHGGQMLSGPREQILTKNALENISGTMGEDSLQVLTTSVMRMGNNGI
jgi:ABC-type Mn2+/Zn2+ transport system ATPase subunit